MTDSTHHNNKRIAKNTMLLYFRMILTMLVTLYTSRVVLNTLGVEDFGIYNVVGGVVVMFSFLNSAMSSATQRFLSFEMGRPTGKRLSQVFSTSLSIHVVLAFVVFAVGETLGLWFFDNYIVIPQARIQAAMWVYQSSLIILVINILSVPYDASIVASEKMSIYAYISIVEVLLKLLIVYMLVCFSYDKLKLYALLLLAVSFLTRSFYIIYCRYKLNFAKYHFVIDKTLIKEMLSHSWWMLFGTSSQMLSTQGVNILMNIFFGVTVNAARGIAIQVRSALEMFVSNFMLAVRPQIIKSYSNSNKAEAFELVFTSSRLAFILVYILTIPILFETKAILNIWLGETPVYFVIFTKLVLVELFIVLLYPPLATISQAAGKIRNYQLMISISFLLVFVFTYLFYKMGFPVYSTFIISIGISFLSLIVRLMIIHKQFAFPLGAYYKKVFRPIIIFAVLSMPFPCLAYILVEESIFRVVLITILNSSFSILVYWFSVSTQNERLFIKNNILIKLKK